VIKVLTSEQVLKADAVTITREPVSSIGLMERAATACCNYLEQHLPAGVPVSFVCGKGNNGGDGLAIARLLWKKGKSITVWITEDTGKSSEDFTINLRRLQEETGVPVQLQAEHSNPGFPENGCIVEAIFGTGLNREPEGKAAEMIRAINASTSRVIAIDIPAGLYSDKATPMTNTIIRANTTLVFQVPRPCFLYAEYEPFIGDFQILDIKLDPEFIADAPAFGFIPTQDVISSLLPYRPRFGHKGTFGHALLLAGSKGKTGAAMLAAGAALRSGAALVTVRCPQCCTLPLQTAVPEAMCIEDGGENHLEEPVKSGPFSAIGIGPGIGTARETGNVLKRAIQDFDIPLVLDADALNLLSENPTWLNFLPAGSILTPHPGEFARLCGKVSDPFTRTQQQLDFAKRYNVYLVLKGKFTAIACPDGQLFFNPTGNHGMAKGGAGDMLTGLLTGLLAQGLAPMKTALLGVYVHGLAGDLCLNEISAYGMKTGDLIDYLPSAWRLLEE
jgi:NAD(P)H-hydrate epimerase